MVGIDRGGVMAPFAADRVVDLLVVVVVPAVAVAVVVFVVGHRMVEGGMVEEGGVMAMA